MGCYFKLIAIIIFGNERVDDTIFSGTKTLSEVKVGAVSGAVRAWRGRYLCRGLTFGPQCRYAKHIGWLNSGLIAHA